MHRGKNRQLQQALAASEEEIAELRAHQPSEVGRSKMRLLEGVRYACQATATPRALPMHATLAHSPTYPVSFARGSEKHLRRLKDVNWMRRDPELRQRERLLQGQTINNHTAKVAALISLHSRLAVGRLPRV